MIVYADRDEVVSTRAFRREIERLSGTERLIRFGQWESAAIDALCPEADDLVDPLNAPLPDTLRIRPAEGFAYYALYPEQYRDAAMRFSREKNPHACVVIGIRTIGTTLSTVVADALPCPARRFTVRPHGHPFERHLCLSERLENEIRRRASDWFLVVDEGPGLSGSSFNSVAEKLNSLGIPDQRIVLFPSHEPDPADFRSEQARRRWQKHPRYVERFDPHCIVPPGARDLSAGQWREVTGVDVAVQGQHERRKYLHDGILWKFSGLGHYGLAKLDRARELKEFVPVARGLDNGFLLMDWVDGEPATLLDDSLLDAMARYLTVLAERFPVGSPDYPGLVEMIRVNTGLECQPPDADSRTVAVDGRMLPHEWIRAPYGWVKTDSLDHHDDHFFPGCQDIAWDIAGAAVEFGFDAAVLAGRYLRLTSDSTLAARLPFYTTAYLAYRVGYCTLAAETLGDTADGRRFRQLIEKYTSLLPTRS